MSEVTVGIDIGTSSVKALAVDGHGAVVASARVPHEYRVPAAERLEHDARVAWRDGPVAALDALALHAQHTVRGVCVAAMVPSLTAVDAQGIPLLPGLLYGDERGRDTSSEGRATGMEFGGFVRWATAEAPGAAGLWPAQAVANHALAGVAAIDMMTASTAHPVYDFTSWDPELAAQLGARVEQFPTVLPPGAAAGTLPGDGGVLASGCIDAMGEQLVAGADEVGDVLVLLGTTLIVWVVAGHAAGEAPGYVVLPDTTAGTARLGGPSNAGGMFCDWVGRLVGPVRGGESTVEPDRVPVWAPYPRGERSPLNDPSRRATLDRLDLTHDAAAVRRAAHEASGFVVRRAIDAAREGFASEPKRIVASGGGSRVDDWVQAIADVTGLHVDCVAVPDGAAFGAAWFARIAAGLEDAAAMADARRWARTGRTIEPRPEWSEAVGGRYQRFRVLSDELS
jgi:xylulokinase